MKARRILVPLDGGREAETALPAAVERAKASGASLYLLYVLAVPSPIIEASASPRRRAAAERAARYLAAARRRIGTDTAVDVSTAIWSGSAAAAIVKAADLIEADLIVMARRGRTGAPRALVGSVIERVLRATRRPVLVVTPADAAVDATPADAAPLPEAGPPPAPAPLAPESSIPTEPDTPPERHSPPGDSYLNALRTVQQCERDVLRVVATIQDASKSLERWPAVHVAHAGAGFPKDVTMMGRRIDASTWPTGQQLGETLSAWHAATEAARVAWGRVPREERREFPPPP